LAKPSTVAGYLASLAPDRRATIAAVRRVVKQHLPKGYVEGLGYRMIAWAVPLRVYPDTYNGEPLLYAALASQKNHLALYLCNAYGSPAIAKQVRDGFKAAGKRLDMGKSCIRFKALDELPLEVIGKTIAATPMKAYVAFAKTVRARKK
jgi:uncharacterized protein YdhG (YjbR/CyaY superfamily)